MVRDGCLAEGGRHHWRICVTTKTDFIDFLLEDYEFIHCVR